MSISQIPSGWTITRSDERIVVQHVSGSFYAAAKEGESGIAESILYMLADSLLSATLSPAHIEDEREACERWIRQQLGMPARIPMDWDGPFNRYTWAAWSARAALSAPPASVPAELTNVRCMCGDEYPHDSYGAGFIAGSGMCENCRAIRGADRKAMDELKAMSFDELLKLSEGKAPPAAGVPIGMACKINGYWEAQLFAGHGCIDRQSLYAHPLPPADVPTGLAHRLLKAYDHGDTGAIEAAIEDIRTMLAAAPATPAAGVPEGWSIQREFSPSGYAIQMPSGAALRITETGGGGVETAFCQLISAMLAAAPTPPASEQQRAVVMPKNCVEPYGWVAVGQFFSDRDQAIKAAEKTACIEVYSRPQLLAALSGNGLRDNLIAPHLAKGEGV